MKHAQHVVFGHWLRHSQEQGSPPGTEGQSHPVPHMPLTQSSWLSHSSPNLARSLFLCMGTTACFSTDASFLFEL